MYLTRCSDVCREKLPWEKEGQSLNSQLYREHEEADGHQATPSSGMSINIELYREHEEADRHQATPSSGMSINIEMYRDHKETARRDRL